MSNSNTSEVPIGALVGIIISSNVIVLLLVMFALFWIWRWRRMKRRKAELAVATEKKKPASLEARTAIPIDNKLPGSNEVVPAAAKSKPTNKRLAENQLDGSNYIAQEPSNVWHDNLSDGGLVSAAEESVKEGGGKFVGRTVTFSSSEDSLVEGNERGKVSKDTYKKGYNVLKRREKEKQRKEGKKTRSRTGPTPVASKPPVKDKSSPAAPISSPANPEKPELNLPEKPKTAPPRLPDTKAAPSPGTSKNSFKRVEDFVKIEKSVVKTEPTMEDEV